MAGISVITVCKNAEETLERTILSVLKQTNNNYEYIIQDGYSNDNTLNIAKTYENRFKKHHIQYKIESEKDSGIYDGMNKAVDKCESEWVFFLNAGDTFYDDRVLEYFELIAAHSLADMVYGHTNYIFAHNKNLIVTRMLEDIFKGMGICQQSIFYKGELLKRRRFDISYKLLADYEYLFYMYKEKIKLEKMNLIVSNFEYNGVSSISCNQVYAERLQIMKQYGLIYKRRRPHLYLQLKEKVIMKVPLLNTLQAIHAELNRKE